MKKAIFISIAILAMVNDYAQAQMSSPIYAPTTAALPVVKVGHTEATLVSLVNPNGRPTAVWFEVDGEIRGVLNGLNGTDAVPVTCRPYGLEPGKFHQFRVHSMNSVGHTMSEKITFFTPSMLSAPEVPVIEEHSVDPDMVLPYVSYKCGDPTILSFVGSLAFFTESPDTVAIYENYAGSAGSGSGDQCGIQFGEGTSQMLDSVETQFTSAASGQVVFDFKNLKSTVQAGVLYKYRLFAFDGVLGQIAFYPSSSGTYPITTDPAAPVSSLGTLILACQTKEASIGQPQSNDATSQIYGYMDTVLTSGPPSPYAFGSGAIPPFNVGVINQTSLMFDYSPYQVWDPNNVAAKYYLKLYITNSLGVADSASSLFPCSLPAGVSELEAGESLTVYPNPASDHVTVKSTVKGSQRMEVYDMRGRLLINQDILDELTTINLGDFSSGIYNYCLFKDGEPVVRDKIAVAK